MVSVLVFAECRGCLYRGHDRLPPNAHLDRLRCPKCGGAESRGYVVDAPLEFQGPCTRTVRTSECGGFVTAVERPVGYEHHLTPAEERLITAIIRATVEREMAGK